MGRAALHVGIHGITAYKVYPVELLPVYYLWALTPLFHPYLASGETVIFCGTFCSLRTRLFTGVLLYAVRTFLSLLKER